MKTTSRNILLLAWSLSMLLCSVKSQSQTAYAAVIRNITIVDSKTIRFDVYLQNTGSTDLKLQALQAGLIFNYDSLANGGTITGYYVPGSSDASLPPKQQSPNWRINATSHQIQLLPAIVMPVDSATAIPSSGGIKLGTFEIKNTVSFPTSVVPNFSWSFTPGSHATTKTMVTCYVNGDVVGTNITSPASHTVVK